MNKVFLLLGSNLGNRSFYLNEAKRIIQISIGAIIKESAVYQTQSWGFKAENDFYNQAILVKTNILPTELLIKIKEIEKELGRKTNGSGSYQSREIDIDILFYNDEIINHKDLIIPHPGIPLRRFVLEPMTEIAYDFIHPQLERSISQLSEVCADKSEVKHLAN